MDGSRCKECGEEYDECGSCDAMLCACEFADHQCDHDHALEEELGQLQMFPEEEIDRRSQDAL